MLVRIEDQGNCKIHVWTYIFIYVYEPKKLNNINVIQGYRQAVRHSTLTAADMGSNPISPAIFSAGLAE